jgi:DNA-binding response OmpR family regulator
MGGGRKGAALVVDADNEVAALAMGALTAMRSAMRVAPARRLAANAIRAEVPDVLILDLHLPFMDGDQILRGVGGLLKRKGTAVIVASALYSPDHARVAEMRQPVACAFLEKPYLPVTLSHAVMDALRWCSSCGPAARWDMVSSRGSARRSFASCPWSTRRGTAVTYAASAREV